MAAFKPGHGAEIARLIAVADALERIEPGEADDAAARALVAAQVVAAARPARLLTARTTWPHEEQGACSVAATFSSPTKVADWLPPETQWKSSASASPAWHTAVTANSITACRTNVFMTCPPCLKEIDALAHF